MDQEVASDISIIGGVTEPQELLQQLGEVGESVAVRIMHYKELIKEKKGKEQVQAEFKDFIAYILTLAEVAVIALSLL